MSESVKNKPGCESQLTPLSEASLRDPSRTAKAALMCRALSDPARLRLLLHLAQQERCVSELVELERGKVTSISARLQTLHNARMVTRRREAKQIFYALADKHTHALLSCILSHASETQT